LYSIINSVAGLIWDFTIKQYPTPFRLLAVSRQPAHLDPSGRHDQCHADIAHSAFLILSIHASGLGNARGRRIARIARLVGINTSWMIALGWGMAAAIGSIAGMMIAPWFFWSRT